MFRSRRQMGYGTIPTTRVRSAMEPILLAYGWATSHRACVHIAQLKK